MKWANVLVQEEKQKRRSSWWSWILSLFFGVNCNFYVSSCYSNSGHIHNKALLKVDESLRKSPVVRRIKNVSPKQLLKSPTFKFFYSFKIQLPLEECLLFKFFLNEVFPNHRTSGPFPLSYNPTVFKATIIFGTATSHTHMDSFLCMSSGGKKGCNLEQFIVKDLVTLGGMVDGDAK